MISEAGVTEIRLNHNHDPHILPIPVHSAVGCLLPVKRVKWVSYQGESLV